MEKRELLEVEWEDIAGGGSWEDMEKDFISEIHQCKTVGWKLPSNRKVLVLASTITSKGRCCDRTVIPRAVIKSMRRLG